MIITTLDAPNTPLSEIWEEIEYQLFRDRKIPRSHEAKCREIFDSYPADEEFEYYEDLADAIEVELCVHLKEDYPLTDRSDQGNSSALTGTLGSLMKVLVGYLALFSSIPGAKAQPMSHSMGLDFLDTCGPIPPGTCSFDSGGGMTCAPPLNQLTDVICKPSVQTLCGLARANPVYNGIIEEVDRECGHVLITGPQNKIGACVFDPSGGTGGEISCKQSGSYDVSKIGHELEHAFDHCASGGLFLREPSHRVISEVHAHTVQAAIAHGEQRLGNSIDSRDRALVADFDAGCPEPTSESQLGNVLAGMYSIIHSYHKLYVKEDLSLKDLKATYGRKIRQAAARYKTMTKQEDPLYSKARSREYKKIK